MRKLFFIGLILYTAVGNAQTKYDDEQTIKQKAKQTVIDFYKWYAINHEKLGRFNLYKGKKSLSNPPYIIDWKEVGKYFTYIRKNIPYLGEAFIANERKFFKKCQKEFNKNPDGEVPFGFDYDRFINSQEEVDYIVDANILNTRNDWKIEIKGNKAIAYITANYTEPVKDNLNKVELTKEKGIWKIAKCIEHVDIDKYK